MHLSVEDLLAVRDGEATADAVAHADSCPQCSAEIERLRAVQGRLAALPEERPAQRPLAQPARRACRPGAAPPLGVGRLGSRLRCRRVHAGDRRPWRARSLARGPARARDQGRSSPPPSSSSSACAPTAVQAAWSTGAPPTRSCSSRTVSLSSTPSSAVSGPNALTRRMSWNCGRSGCDSSTRSSAFRPPAPPTSGFKRMKGDDT